MPEGRNQPLWLNIFSLILQYAVPVPVLQYWRLSCCGLVCKPHAYWLVCAQPLFLSVNSPLDHSTSTSSTSTTSSSSPSSHGTGLAECQYLGRTPTCYHNDTLIHTGVSQASSQFKQQIGKLAFNVWIRTSIPSYLKLLHVRFHTILRQTRNTCLIPYKWPARSPPSACQSDIAVVWARVWARVWRNGSVCFLAISIFMWSRSCHAPNNKYLHYNYC